MAGSANYIGAVQEYIQKLACSAQPPLPEYEELGQGMGSSLGSQFGCKVTLPGCDARYTAVGYGRKKKEAKNNAAGALLELMSNDPPHLSGHQAAPTLQTVSLPPILSSRRVLPQATAAAAVPGLVSLRAANQQRLPPLNVPLVSSSNQPDVVQGAMLASQTGMSYSSQLETFSRHINRRFTCLLDERVSKDTVNTGMTVCSLPLRDVLASSADDELKAFAHEHDVRLRFREVSELDGGEDGGEVVLCLLFASAACSGVMERIVTHGSGYTTGEAFRQALLAAVQHMVVAQVWRRRRR